MAAGQSQADTAESAAGSQRALWLLIGGIFVVSLDSRVIAPLLPAIAEDFNASIGQAGWIVTAYLLPYGLFQLVYGPIADRIGRVRVVSVTLGGFALGTLLCALAPGMTSLVIFRLFTGLAAAAIFPLTLTYIGDTVEYSRRHQIIGYTVMSQALGQVLSNAIGGLLAGLISWRAIFLIDSLIALVITVALLREPLSRVRAPGAVRSALAPYRDVFADRRHVLFYLLVFIEGGFTIGSFSYFGALLRDRDGFSFTAIGVILAILGLASVVSGRLIGRLSQQFDEKAMIAMGGVGVTVCYVLTAIEPAIPFFLIAMAIVGATYIIMHTTLQKRATELAPQARATGIAVFAFSLFLGSSVGAFVVAQVIAAAGYNWTMLALAVITGLFTLVATATVIRWSQPHTAAE